MRTYVIQHKVDTLLNLWNPFEFDGFHFQAWGTNYQTGEQHGWLATKQIKADTANAAYKEFSKKFHRLVDRIAFVGQCHTSANLEAFLVKREDDPRFYWRWARRQEPAPLHFQEGEIRSLRALDAYREKGDVFRCLREAAQATSFYTMNAMLCAALEAIAGPLASRHGPRTDRKYIANEILEDRQLCDRLFKHEDGIRNQNLHGKFVDTEMHGSTNYNEIVYDSVVSYFNKKHGTEISDNAVNRPRTRAGSYRRSLGFCKWVGGVSISLEILDRVFNTSDADQYYVDLDRMPDDF